MKKRILSLGMALIMMLSAIAMAGCSKKEVYKPTFMYFVSGSDANYDEAMAVAAELEKEYGKKVTFDIHNID